MNYTQPSLFTQDENIELPKNISSEYLMLPSGLNGFTNTETQTRTSLSMRQVFCFTGKLKEDSYSYTTFAQCVAIKCIYMGTILQR